MPELDPGGRISRGVLFGGVFSRGDVDAGDTAWLRAMPPAPLAAMMTPFSSVSRKPTRSAIC